MKHTLLLTTLLASTVANVFAADDGSWMIRGRGIAVAPSNDGGQTSIGGKVHAGSQVVPEVDISYFATSNVAFELIAATTRHSIKVDKKPATTDLGNVWLLPPTLTAQYHFTNLGAFKPYVGAGFTYAHFYNAEHPGFASVKYEDKVGAALQAGADYRLGQSNFYLNADVKKIFVSTNATVNDTITAKANLNPWVAGMGVGYRF